MRFRLTDTRAGRWVGAALLSLSLVHTPLPQPDFHKVRHHDAPGEVCERHDHLLRWHPRSAASESSPRDVAVLHWHWFFATPDGSDPAPESAGKAVHAHTQDWSAGSWDDGRAVTAVASAESSRSMVDLPAFAFGSPEFDARPAFSPLLMRPSGASRAPVAPRPPLASVLQRWAC